MLSSNDQLYLYFHTQILRPKTIFKLPKSEMGQFLMIPDDSILLSIITRVVSSNSYPFSSVTHSTRILFKTLTFSLEIYPPLRFAGLKGIIRPAKVTR